MIRTKKLVFLSLVCSTLLYANNTKNTNATNLDSITVTANKVEENIKDVPQSITVMDETIIEEKGLKNVIDIINQVPGMYAATDNGTSINFRGLNTSLFTRNNPVVIYINGIPSSNKFDFDPSLANIERVEILRGPQSTLYGKDAIGAVINIITKEDYDYWRGAVNFEFGTDKYNLTKFNINGPLIENRLFWGLNGELERDDGWITNTASNMDDNANRNKKRKLNTYFTFKPTDRLTTKLSISSNKENVYWQDGYVTDTQTPLKDLRRDKYDNEVRYDDETFEEYINNSQSITLKYAFDNFDLTSVSTHKKYETEAEFDGDYTDNPLNRNLMFDYKDTKSLTQEIRLSSSSNDSFKWVTGLYYENEEEKSSFYGMDFGAMRQNIPSVLDNNTYALFGQVMIPFAEDFEFTLGGRYQKIKKKADIDVFMYPKTSSQPDTPIASSKGDKTWTEFIPKVALSYKINDNWSSFISYSKGYLPGGFNFYNNSNNINDALFDPQKSTNYEVGIKGNFGNTNLMLSAFRMDITDIHIYKVEGARWLTDNAKKAISQGIELEATHFLNDNWELNASLGFIDAEYKDYDNGTVKLDGQKIQHTPEYMARIGLAYYGNDGFYGRTDLNFQGETAYFNSDRNIMDKANSYFTANLKLGFKINKWDIYAYGKNLFNEDYIKAYNGAYNLGRVHFGDPRKIGIGFKYSF